MEFVKVPDDRVGVVIGKNGEEKKRLESLFSVKLQVTDNRVGIDGDALGVLKAKDAVKALGRGFSPERAHLLAKEDSVLETIDLSAYGDKERERLKSRVIGRNGRVREQIETMTGAEISVYGKTVSLIGTPSCVSLAREAISLLLEGASHGAAFKFISKKRRDSWQL